MGDLYAVGEVGQAPSSYRLVTLPAFSLSSFAGGVAGIASSLLLGLHNGLPLGSLGEFPIAGLLLGFERGLTSGSLGGLRRG
jgi:hypothetical protein